MASDPIVFAMANPDPEITYPRTPWRRARRDHGDRAAPTTRTRSTTCSGFPFIFRGALDVRATGINEEMKMAAAQALAGLAKEDVPDSVLPRLRRQAFKFGREYLIPKPFDSRVLLWEAPAVAEAAIKGGVAARPWSSKRTTPRSWSRGFPASVA